MSHPTAMNSDLSHHRPPPMQLSPPGATHRTRTPRHKTPPSAGFQYGLDPSPRLHSLLQTASKHQSERRSRQRISASKARMRLCDGRRPDGGAFELVSQLSDSRVTDLWNLFRSTTMWWPMEKLTHVMTGKVKIWWSPLCISLNYEIVIGNSFQVSADRGRKLFHSFLIV